MHDFFIGEHGHPYYANGQPYPHWDYSKPWSPPPDSALVPQTFPPPAEVGEYEPSKYELETIAKAEAKRARKALRP